MPLVLYTPKEIAERIAGRVREDRLARGWTREQLAERAGVPLMTYRRFERTGQISLERLLAVASALGRTSEWEDVFRPRAAQSLDDVAPDRPARQRGTPRRSRRRPTRRPDQEKG